jgi:hypothetical protein
MEESRGNDAGAFSTAPTKALSPLSMALKYLAARQQKSEAEVL